MHTSDFSLSLFCRVGKLEKNLNNVKSQRIRIAPLHFSSFSKEERREREREKSLFGFFCSVSSVHILNTQTRRRGSAKTGTQSNKMLSPFKSWNKQREVRKDGERMFDDISNNNNNDNNNNNNNTSSNSTVTYKTRLMTFFGRRKKKTMAAVPKKEKATQGNNNNDDDKENNNDVGTVPLAGDNETKTTTTTTKEVVVKKPTQKRAQKLKENVQKSKEENAVNARLREQRDYFNKIDKMSSLQSESECSPLPARNNAGRNMELSPLGVIKAVGGLEFDGVDAKKAMKETLEEQQQRHQHQYAKDEEQEEAEEEEFSFPTPQQQPQFLLGNNATPSPASQDRRTAEWLVSSQLPAVSEHALLESVRNLTLEEKINEENEDEKEAASSSSSPSSIKETESIAQTKSQSYKSPFNKSARSSRRRTSSVHSYHSIHDYKPVLATKNAHRVSEGSLPKEQRRSSLGGAIRKSIVGLQATVVNTDAPSPLVEIENEEEEKEEVKTEEKSATVTKEDSSELGPLEALLKECEQSPEDVKTVAEEVKKAKDPNSKKKSITVEKIGEGTYGEAYMCDNVVLKVVPISNEKKEPGTNTKKGKENVENNAEECEGEEDYPQMVASEIRAEVAVAKRLTKLQPHLVAPKAKNVTDGFVPLDRVAICKGPYDKLLLKAWESFDFRKVSENENPSMWPKDQLYVVFSTRNGGIDLENFNLHDCKEAFSVLLQITVALAVAEEACGFEHRDLHWGNVLCKRDKVDLENDNTRKARLNGVDVTIDTYGVTASIIDFTLSRVEIKDESDVVFCDLSLDPELFEGPEDDAQSETYRRMRKALNNQWGASCPQTNAFWLHYLADTLLTKKEFKMNPNQKQSLEKFRMNCLQYDCAADAIWDPLFAGMWSSGRK